MVESGGIGGRFHRTTLRADPSELPGIRDRALVLGRLATVDLRRVGERFAIAAAAAEGQCEPGGLKPILSDAAQQLGLVADAIEHLLDRHVRGDDGPVVDLT